MKMRDVVIQLNLWQKLKDLVRVKVRDIYLHISDFGPDVQWRKILFDNKARPRAKFVTWMTCHGNLATKERLKRFGMLQTDHCGFCRAQETIEHLFFECRVMKQIWSQILDWLQVKHNPRGWIMELAWMLQQTKKKSWKTKVLKMAFSETIYACWRLRNDTVFGNTVQIDTIGPSIIDTLIYRAWMC
ncbi:uncharacterized protein LOC131634099 [Vicia villosa]|uniref:uncharacterized protein LOC131634099 n=1 Tax=Vicia villosa TaxID=3911 RepID=UPI00273B8AD2|nr:uncharacterized protein LOC131634099 [Vicia villosa]